MIVFGLDFTILKPLCLMDPLTVQKIAFVEFRSFEASIPVSSTKRYCASAKLWRTHHEEVTCLNYIMTGFALGVHVVFYSPASYQGFI